MSVLIGDQVSDRISGFEGITTGRTEYLNGCRQFLVRPSGLDDTGKPREGVWIDEQNLTVTLAQVLPDPFRTDPTVKAGGPIARLARTTDEAR